jgi:kynurenine formamidase
MAADAQKIHQERPILQERLATVAQPPLELAKDECPIISETRSVLRLAELDSANFYYSVRRESVFVDMTLPLEDGMQLFPELSSFESEPSVADDTDAITRRFASSSHQGTHVDAPRHYIPDGPTLGEIRLESWFGAATVIDLRESRGEAIDAATLESSGIDPEPGTRLLLLTGDIDYRFGDQDFFEEAAHLTASGAEWLADHEPALVGNDFLTEALSDLNRPVHKTLLGAGIPLVEYLCAADAVADHKRIEFTCLPLNVPTFEASPVRAIARIESPERLQLNR